MRFFFLKDFKNLFVISIKVLNTKFDYKQNSVSILCFSQIEEL